VAAGIGEGEKFKVTYDSKTQIFYVVASIETVEGVGFGGRFCVEIDGTTIKSFVIFLYHQIKNNNYSYTGLFMDAAYQAWVGITTIAVWAGNEITHYWRSGVDDAQEWFNNLIDNEVSEADRQRMLIKSLNTNEQQVKFAPPETKGRWLYQLCQQPELAREYWEYDIWHRQQAIALLLGYIQSEREYHVVLKNMIDTTKENIGQAAKTISVAEGRLMLWESVSSVVYVGTDTRLEYNKYQIDLDAEVKAKARAMYAQAQYRAEAYKVFSVSKMKGF